MTGSGVSRGARAAFCLFLAGISLSIGSVAVVIAVPPLELAYTASRSTPVGIYAAFVLVGAIATPILCVIAAFIALLFGRD